MKFQNIESYLTKNVYSRNGQLVKVCDSNEKALWQLHEKNAYGQILACEMGSGVYYNRFEYDDMTHILKNRSGMSLSKGGLCCPRRCMTHPIITP